MRICGYAGLGICFLYRKDSEYVSHLFYHCSFFNLVWEEACSLVDMHEDWKGSDLDDNLFRWFHHKEKFKDLPSFISWEVWKMRNKFTFQNIFPSILVYFLHLGTMMEADCWFKTSMA